MRIQKNVLAGCAFLALSLSAGPGRAHDLKVLVSRPVVDPGQQDTVYLSYGHVLPVDTPVDAETLDDYSLKSPSGSVVYLKKEGVSLQLNEVPVEEEGTYQAVATRKPLVFSEVVDGQGNHTHVRAPRSAVTEGTVESATRSLQFAKALLVSGSKNDGPPEPLGHLLEIVPVEEPSGWKSGRDLNFLVLFRGKPLANADLLGTYVGFKPDKAWCYATTTGPAGAAVVRPSQAGTWVLKVKVQKPAPKERQAEYDLESYTATLVFEVRP